MQQICDSDFRVLEAIDDFYEIETQPRLLTCSAPYSWKPQIDERKRNFLRKTS